MNATRPRRPPAWAYPATYLAHIVDEATYAQGFPAWFSGTTGADLSLTEFAWINGIGFAAVSAVAWRTSGAGGDVSVPRAALATIVLTNGLLHLAASLLTGAAVPGVLTGTLLWIPLGGWAFASLVHDSAPRRIIAGAAVGLLAHLGVTWIAWQA
jgi:hypothetical protein